MDRSVFAKALKSTYLLRKERNPLYSIRAFSRDLGISSGRVNNYLNGVEVPNEQNLDKIIAALQLSSKKAASLKAAAESSRYLNRGLGFSKALNEAQFSKVSAWQTWSVLTLFQSCDFKPSIDWFAKQTGFSAQQIEKSLNQLAQAELIAPKGDFYTLTYENVTTTNDVPSQAIRKFHKQFLKLAERALDKVPIDQRDISSITMCADPAKMAQVKKLIWEFRARINSIMEEKTKNNSLYQLNIQLFPISQNLEQKK